MLVVLTHDTSGERRGHRWPQRLAAPVRCGGRRPHPAVCGVIGVVALGIPGAGQVAVCASSPCTPLQHTGRAARPSLSAGWDQVVNACNNAIVGPAIIVACIPVVPTPADGSPLLLRHHIDIEQGTVRPSWILCPYTLQQPRRLAPAAPRLRQPPCAPRCQGRAYLRAPRCTARSTSPSAAGGPWVSALRYTVRQHASWLAIAYASGLTPFCFRHGQLAVPALQSCTSQWWWATTQPSAPAASFVRGWSVPASSSVTTVCWCVHSAIAVSPVACGRRGQQLQSERAASLRVLGSLASPCADSHQPNQWLCDSRMRAPCSMF
jgi:hypothetical protein